MLWIYRIWEKAFEEFSNSLELSRIALLLCFMLLAFHRISGKQLHIEFQRRSEWSLNIYSRVAIGSVSWNVRFHRSRLKFPCSNISKIHPKNVWVLRVMGLLVLNITPRGAIFNSMDYEIEVYSFFFIKKSPKSTCVDARLPPGEASNFRDDHIPKLFHLIAQSSSLKALDAEPKNLFSDAQKPIKFRI